MATIKELLNQTLSECGFDQVPSFATSQIQSAVQVFALANRELYTIQKKDWQGLKRTYLLPLTAATEYPLPDDYLQFVPDTSFATDQERKADFPVDDETWAYLKARDVATGLTYRVRIANNQIEVHNPRDGEELYFSYISKYAASNAGGVPKQRFTADDDTFDLIDDLMEMGVKWRFNKMKGLEWKADFAEYGKMLRSELGTDKSAQTLNFAGGAINEPVPPQADLYLPL
jgi:hypothetical protein